MKSQRPRCRSAKSHFSIKGSRCFQDAPVIQIINQVLLGSEISSFPQTSSSPALSLTILKFLEYRCILYLLHKTPPPPTHTLAWWNTTRQERWMWGGWRSDLYPANEGCAVAHSHPASATHCAAYCWLLITCPTNSLNYKLKSFKVWKSTL